MFLAVPGGDSFLAMAPPRGPSHNRRRYERSSCTETGLSALRLGSVRPGLAYLRLVWPIMTARALARVGEDKVKTLPTSRTREWLV
jgi:hypothetical protein